MFLNGLSLSLRKGEILVSAGVEGNGQTEEGSDFHRTKNNYKGEFIKHTDKISLVLMTDWKKAWSGSFPFETHNLKTVMKKNYLGN